MRSMSVSSSFLRTKTFPDVRNGFWRKRGAIEILLMHFSYLVGKKSFSFFSFDKSSGYFWRLECLRILVALGKNWKFLLNSKLAILCYKKPSANSKRISKLISYKKGAILYKDRILKHDKKLYIYPSGRSPWSAALGLKFGISDRKNMPKILGSSKLGRPFVERGYVSIESVGGNGS